MLIEIKWKIHQVVWCFKKSLYTVEVLKRFCLKSTSFERNSEWENLWLDASVNERILIFWRINEFVNEKISEKVCEEKQFSIKRHLDKNVHEKKSITYDRDCERMSSGITEIVNEIVLKLKCLWMKVRMKYFVKYWKRL